MSQCVKAGLGKVDESRETNYGAIDTAEGSEAEDLDRIVAVENVLTWHLTTDLEVSNHLRHDRIIERAEEDKCNHRRESSPNIRQTVQRAKDGNQNCQYCQRRSDAEFVQQ